MSEDSIRDRLRRQCARRGKSAPPAAIEGDPAARRSVFDALGRHARRASDDPSASVPVHESAARASADSSTARVREPLDPRGEGHCVEEAGAKAVQRASPLCETRVGADVPPESRVHPLARSKGDVIPLPVRELSLVPPRELVLDEQGVAARTRFYPGAHRHGSWTLDRVFEVSPALLAQRARDERLVDVDLRRAVFFDTETTGLSGGAGTYVFLVGLMRFVDGRFELWQGFLPHPSEEKKLLDEVARRIADASVLISFFGKSFDRHRLEDKMRLHGVAPPFATTVHLDIYHPLRRAHRGRFENCKLKTLERELVGVARPDDLPGSFAPAAWFDFLGGRPHRLEGVFQHNADDVLSLAALLCHMTAD